MKRKIVGIICVCMALVLMGCSKSEETTSDGPKLNEDGKMEITLAGLSGGMQTFPFYVAQEKGYFEEQNIEVNVIYFDNGPVQMEALASGSWDVSATGIGGVLTGAIAYDAKVIGTTNSDDGTQYVFARKDSDIVAAGQGNNSIDPRIYGDAESWKGKKILCSAGTVLQYLLIKTLGGFDLTLDDVEFMAMDTPTTNSAFLQGQGDVCVLTGLPSLNENKKDFVKISGGTEAKAGLVNNIVASEDALKYKREEVIAFMTAYLKAIDWIDANKEEAEPMLLAFCDLSGKSTTAEVAHKFINAETFYGLDKNYENMTTIADGTDMCTLENDLINILQFFIDSNNYSQGDDEIFKGHVDSSIIEDIYNSAKAN
jgi:ABC-type nitrate/sulfonate/bicarbonate transport system substrate-binding protein